MGLTGAAEGVGGRKGGEANDIKREGLLEDFRDNFGMAPGTENDEAGLGHGPFFTLARRPVYTKNERFPRSHPSSVGRAADS